MKLPNGVTGFYKVKQVNKIPEIDYKQFTQVCFALAIRLGGKVQSHRDLNLSSNFYYSVIEIFDKQIYVLLNKHYPLLAFASVVEYGNIQFIDQPELNKEFSIYYQVLSANELDAPPHFHLLHLSDLNDAEIKQIKYWTPTTIGQIIYNFWS